MGRALGRMFRCMCTFVFFLFPTLRTCMQLCMLTVYGYVACWDGSDLWRLQRRHRGARSETDGREGGGGGERKRERERERERERQRERVIFDVTHAPLTLSVCV